MNFFGTCPSLVSDSPALLKEKIVGENYVNVGENYVNVMQVEVVRLGDILKLS